MLHPALEGEGRLTWSAAECETGWGDLSARTVPEWRDHPTSVRIACEPILPLQGRMRAAIRYARLLRIARVCAMSGSAARAW
ncbi:hypothetical protein M2192_007066 [Bradyrhizobium elkanii USDA 61]|uniref:Uncharacterized protein n=1 Tax=Bradyrhizobium elkanii TaxID=29448 RepID=A0A8I1Y5D7_BRAEL|nr:hypothetical protein [Bradyrhizobium elkanii]MCS4010106.1 hypothetical protein [Bradyrhizobium elkanii USDA 61]MCP1926504.1 hypothetical protein [Bradyrhizobium elkanii]MCS3475971.1 hypothetical protein [Bradyrhizobium elkanii]MCS3582820.1 hypothetical protein [Bradyrhizobium elkanii]